MAYGERRECLGTFLSMIDLAAAGAVDFLCSRLACSPR